MKKLISLTLSVSLVASMAVAQPAVTTAKVNLRQGPGTNYASLGQVAQGSKVDLSQCDSAGAWCSITFGGRKGFVNGKFLNASEAERPSWPRVYTTDAGGEITLYQPQVTDWPNFAEITALIATEYKATKEAKPIFGIIGVSGQTVADADTENVVVSNVKVTDINFSALDRKALSDLSLEVGKVMPTGSIAYPEERLTASLADYKRMDDVQGLKSDPPVILTSDVASILVQTDGDAVYAPVKGVDGLSLVANTNWDLFKLDADNSYYLRDDKTWLTSKDLAGDWTAVTTLPDRFSKLPDDDNWKDAHAAMPPTTLAGKLPKVFYSSKPAELIQFDGKPALVGVPGTKLKWASNSASDVFFNDADRQWYVLLSGRWFSSASLDGPWTFATPNLPTDFQNIPDDAPYYAVRSSVPGTSENAEARLKASIPRTARVATDGSVTVDVAYSGDPKFEPIGGTSLTYAVNTNEQVIKVGDKYFVLKDGVWFVGLNPTGPFSVATEVPAEIYKIPPSSPVYNATYVRVYNTEPGAVWFGYTMGYLGAYLAWDAIVYGTGWYYHPYWAAGWAGGGYLPYYPRPLTYGVAAFYNPAVGTFGRYGYAYGPYRGIAGGAAYNPRTGTYIRGGAIAGPNGAAGFMSAYNPRTGNGVIARGGQNVYGSWETAGVKHGSEFARVNGGANANGAAAQWRTSEGNHGFVAAGGGGDVYAGRDGNVYRKDGGQWQKHTDGGWSPVQRPSTDGLKNVGQNIADRHPGAANNIANRPGANGGGVRNPVNRPNRILPAAPDNLGIDRAGRQFGNQRALQHQMIRRPPPESFGGFHGGGGRFGGGGFRGGGFHRR
jgi:hypothetical protein